MTASKKKPHRKVADTKDAALEKMLSQHVLEPIELELFNKTVVTMNNDMVIKMLKDLIEHHKAELTYHTNMLQLLERAYAIKRKQVEQSKGANNQ